MFEADSGHRGRGRVDEEWGGSFASLSWQLCSFAMVPYVTVCHLTAFISSAGKMMLFVALFACWTR
jgi:hypothetical protein